MLRPDQMEASMSGVRDQIIAAMEDHERHAHHGEVCPANRASVVAYIAHSLGVRGEAWEYAEREHGGRSDG